VIRKEYVFNINEKATFIKKLLLWSSSFERSCFLHSNDYNSDNHKHLYPDYNLLIGIGCADELIVKYGEENPFEKLKKFHSSYRDYIFGFLTYDLKNEIEDLDSNNIDNLEFPYLHFFVPQYVFVQTKDEYKLLYRDETINPEDLIKEINSVDISEDSKLNKIDFMPRMDKSEYLKRFNEIQRHLKRGDIYEMNFCQEFYTENIDINPYNVFLALNNESPVPFGGFYKLGDKYLMCASPERFLKKKNNQIISQPIKGTVERGENLEEDNKIVESFRKDDKERAENIMIVDLVRNDLSRTAQKASVKVKELCGVYAYPQVHQMISTVVSEKRDDIDIVDVIETCWPMGSMTGAPKISSMQIIENLELSRRGLYSGSIGYISPDKDFDFNVVIRSLLYNESKKYLSCTFGGAITLKSEGEKEYEECLLKAKAIKKIFS